MLYILAALTTWRLSHMILRENGPWGVFRAIRIRLGVAYLVDDEHTVVSFKYEITVCLWCLSVWVGAAAAVVLWLAPGWLQFTLLTPLALSAAAILFDRLASMGSK